ncbi:MAG TPA: MHYT domain-containing protein [Gammaproteobacteria bacterium]|nr:MHYT domain-containing protein [Gammaproteobacteria bacterium]
MDSGHHLKFLSADVDLGSALNIDYDPLLVIVSYLVAAFGSYAALTIGEHLRIGSGGRFPRLWLTVGAIAMGLGVWAMHFIGMLAARTALPVTYDTLVTGLSIVPAAVAGCVCLAVLGRNDAGPRRIVLAGITMGAGIGVMHYVGMAAMRMNADMRYDLDRFLLSVAIAVVLATAALYLAFLARRMRNVRTWVVLVMSAMVMGLAITAMHYTGMWAVYYFPLGSAAELSGIDTTTLAVSVMIASVSIISLTIVTLAVSRRFELARTEAQLNQLQQRMKLDAVGQLTGGVAHEFNNLLTIILGNLHFLEENLQKDRTLNAFVQDALAAGHRGAELIKRLLSFSQRQLLTPRIMDINKVLTDPGMPLGDAINAGISLTIRPAGELWLTEIDRNQLESALFNLIINSSEAMPNGGTLTIETSNAVLAEDYAAENPGVTPGEYVLLSVRDSGSGISRDVLSRVFEPFFSTKEVGKGAGLGLSMVYGFVMQSKGHINIYSEEAQGTSVHIYLPRSGAAGQQAIVSSATGTQTQKRRDRILLVEDDAGVRQAGSRILQGLGYQVFEAENGASALAILETHADIDLLFSDVVLPGGMSGPELARHARKHNRRLKVLFTSGYSDTVVFNAGAMQDGETVLDKPYRIEELANTVREILDQPQYSPA